VRQLGDEQAKALGLCVAALSSLESQVTGGIVRLMTANGSAEWVVADRLTAGAARETFLVLVRQRTHDEELLRRSKSAMSQAAALATKRNELLHAFFFQGSVTTRGRKQGDPSSALNLSTRSS
jgi:hypothetical protein